MSLWKTKLLTFNWPNHPTEKKRGIETAKGQLDGVPFQLANGRNDETKAHSTQTLQDGQDDYDENVASALDFKDQNHENQHESCLAAHHHKLGHHMGEQDLSWGYSCKNRVHFNASSRGTEN